MIRKSRSGDFWLIDSDTHISAWCEQHGKLGHDTNMLPLILPHIPVGGTVVDAGSYIGDHTASYLERVGPTGRVLAFEPMKEAHDCLRLNCPHAFCFRAALSDHIGTCRVIPADDNNFGTARIADEDFNCVVNSVDTVPMLTIDSLELLDRLDYCKLDTEGTELRILKGGVKTVKKFRPVMVIEIHQSALKAAGTSPEELLAFIKGLNYDVQNIYPRQEMGGPQWDALCLPL